MGGCLVSQLVFPHDRPLLDDHHSEDCTESFGSQACYSCKPAYSASLSELDAS